MSDWQSGVGAWALLIVVLLLANKPLWYHALRAIERRQRRQANNRGQKTARGRGSSPWSANVPHTEWRNIFEIWESNGRKTPFKVVRQTWNRSTDHYLLVGRIETRRGSGVSAFGRYFRNGITQEERKINDADCREWKAINPEEYRLKDAALDRRTDGGTERRRRPSLRSVLVFIMAASSAALVALMLSSIRDHRLNPLAVVDGVYHGPGQSSGGAIVRDNPSNRPIVHSQGSDKSSDPARRSLDSFLTDSQPAPGSSTVSGRASVVDGDTIEIHGERIRFHGIDAPESDQLCQDGKGQSYRCGSISANALDKLLAKSQPIRCDFVDRDRYGRFVGNCFRADNVNVSASLVRSGLALDWPRYSNGFYAKEQDAAKAERIGVWQGKFELPWVWRDQNREAEIQQHAAPASSLFSGGASGCNIKGNISEKGERIYHVPGQRYYGKTKISESKGERWFCTEADARAAGWRGSRR